MLQNWFFKPALVKILVENHKYNDGMVKSSVTLIYRIKKRIFNIILLLYQ